MFSPPLPLGAHVRLHGVVAELHGSPLPQVHLEQLLDCPDLLPLHTGRHLHSLDPLHLLPSLTPQVVLEPAQGCHTLPQQLHALPLLPYLPAT